MVDTNTEEGDFDLFNPPFPLTATDHQLLAMDDSDFHLLTWDDLRHIIANNTLQDLKRQPSQIRRYLTWCHRIKQRYGSISAFVIQERLRWTPIPTPAPTPALSSEPNKDATATPATPAAPAFAHRSIVPFAERSDYAVLMNDWPYGLVAGIAHLLVWSKTPIAVDAVRGDVTVESRRLIEDFVERYFIQEIDGLGSGDGDGRERVMWFKNWASLQSVRGVDHVHVLVRDAPQSLLERWTERHDL